MSKFCPQCGEEIYDNTAFCFKCGAKQEPQSPAGMYMNNIPPSNLPLKTEKKKSNLPFIIIIAFLSAVIVAMVLVYFLVLREEPSESDEKEKEYEYSELIDMYTDSINEKDAEMMLDCYYAPILETQFISDYENDWIDTSMYSSDDWREYSIDNNVYMLEQRYDEEYYEIGKIKRYSCEILDEYEIDPDELIDYYDEYYDFNLEVEDYRNIVARIDVKGEDGEESYFTQMEVAKIDGEWYRIY